MFSFDIIDRISGGTLGLSTPWWVEQWINEPIVARYPFLWFALNSKCLFACMCTVSVFSPVYRGVAATIVNLRMHTYTYYFSESKALVRDVEGTASCKIIEDQFSTVFSTSLFAGKPLKTLT
jgi:hypothetical protein